jgi:site-specific DNA-methyltransferase (adenine-specific)
MLELNKIYQGDCLEVMKQIEDGSIDLIVTDPPYLISYKTNYRNDKKHDFCSEIENDNNPKLIKDYISECYRIMKNNTAMYMFCSFDKVEFFKTELQKYFKIKNMIIWVKNNWTAGDLTAQFGKQYEIIFLVNKGRKTFNGKRITDIWNFSRICGKKQLHQNQKPEELIKQCILKHSNENEIVFDGFMGSGTTAVACINTNRNFIGIELDENCCKIAEARIKKVVKRKPTKRWRWENDNNNPTYF